MTRILQFLVLVITYAALGANVALAQSPTPCAATPFLVLYEHANFQGAYIIVPLDQDIANLNTWRFNDRASSVKVFVPQHRRLVLYQDLRNGNQIALRPGYWELPHLGAEGLNDKISSIYWE